MWSIFIENMKDVKKTINDDSSNSKNIELDELESLIESKKIQNQAFQKIIKNLSELNNSKKKQ